MVTTQSTPQELVRQQIHDNASLSAAYMVMNILATIVACYGLLADSTAVVIGAMVIAMLLGPITGIALALVDGDSLLLRKAFLAEVAGVIIVVATAFVIGAIHRDIPLGKEIIARTSPNILDLIIALAGGAAGAYVMVSPRLNAGLVGVAIATALVPPLCASAILLARGETQLAFGAFLLFFANFVAIQFSSSLVLWLRGFHQITRRPQDGRALLWRNAGSLGLLAILAIVLGLNFAQSLSRQLYEAEVRSRLTQGLDNHPGAYLAEWRFERSSDTILVTAVVRTPSVFTPQEVAGLESQLPSPAGQKLELRIRSVLTTETTREGNLNGAPAAASP